MTASDRLRALVAEATPGPWTYFEGSDVWSVGTNQAVLLDEDPADSRLIALAPQLAELVADMGEALLALVERVEMDESVGICLTSRVESLNGGTVLARLRALFPEDK